MAAMASLASATVELPQMWQSVDDLLASKLLSRGLNRGEFSRQFDKDGLSKWHMVAAKEYQRMVDQEVALNVFHLMEMERNDAPLESLQKMEISGLDPRVIQCDQGKTLAVHSQHALYGRLCVPAFKTGGVQTVLEDSTGRAVPVVIHHAAAKDFPVGMVVAIKQPCFATLTRADRCVGVMVDNPTLVVNVNAPRVSADADSTAGCSEVIGPVQIGLGKDEHNTGRRGLFAARDVNHGEVILRTRPLTRGKKGRGRTMLGLITSGSKIDAATPFPERLLPSPMQELVLNMVKAAQQYPRCAHMIYSLALSDNPTKSIPPIALFDASVKGGKYEPLALDIGRIRRTIATNVAGTGGTGDAEASAVWALPSFMNHDCEPNCGVSYDGEEGEVQIIRAHGNVPAGTELTLGYWDVGRTWHYRQRKSRELHFACSCRRCLFEERLAKSAPRFKQLSKHWHDINEAHLLTVDPMGMPHEPSAPKVSAQSSSSLLKDEVENMLLRARMTPQQKDWIRKSFSQQAGRVRAYSSSTGGSSRKGSQAAELSVLSSSASLGAGFHVHHNSMLSAFLPRRLQVWRPVLKLLP